MAVSVLSFYRDPAKFVSPVAALIIPAGELPSPKFRDLQRFWILDETGRQAGMLYVKQKVLIQLTGLHLLPIELYCWRTGWMTTRAEVVAYFREVCREFGIVVIDALDLEAAGNSDPLLFETPNPCVACKAPLWAFNSVSNRMHREQEICIECGVRHRREITDDGSGCVYYDLPEDIDIKNKMVRTKLDWRIGKTDKTKDGVLVEKHVVTNELDYLRSLGRVYLNNQFQVIGETV